MQQDLHAPVKCSTTTMHSHQSKANYDVHSPLHSSPSKEGYEQEEKEVPDRPHWDEPVEDLTFEMRSDEDQNNQEVMSDSMYLD